MIFTKLRLIGLSAVDFPIVGALPSDPYLLLSADGLGPPEVNVSIADTLNAGGVYQRRSPQRRQPVLLIGLNPDHGSGETVSELRQSLYGMLTPGYIDYVTLQILNVNDVLMFTTGYVEKVEINPFSKDPQVQLTFDSTQPYFQASNLTFINPLSKVTPVIPNDGTAPAGFRMEVIFTSPLSSWTLSDNSGKKMKITYDFIAGDKLIIDTRPGSRGIWRERAGITLNIVGSLSADSTWYMLHGGDNIFTTSSQAFNWGDLFYLPQFWGI
jgi:hypothetical protein